MLPRVAGKRPGDAQANGMNSGVDLVGGFQMMPENPMIIDGPHIMTGDNVIILNPAVGICLG